MRVLVFLGGRVFLLRQIQNYVMCVRNLTAQRIHFKEPTKLHLQLLMEVEIREYY